MHDDELRSTELHMNNSTVIRKITCKGTLEYAYELLSQIILSQRQV